MDFHTPTMARDPLMLSQRLRNSERCEREMLSQPQMLLLHQRLMLMLGMDIMDMDIDHMDTTDPTDTMEREMLSQLLMLHQMLRPMLMLGMDTMDTEPDTMDIHTDTVTMERSKFYCQNAFKSN